MPRSVLAIAAHPDDIEFVMAGTMIHLRRAGWRLHYVTLANGCCGSTTTDAAATARIRREESIEACRRLGATYYESLVDDLCVFYDRATLARLAAVVRAASPDIVLTHSPEDYMEDHMNTCRLAVTAAFARGMPNFSVDPPTPPVPGAVTVYHAQPHGNCDGLGQPVRPSLFVDTGDVMAEKAHALAAHGSQQEWLDQSQGMNSYLAAMHQLSRAVGRMSGCYEHAEGWRRHSHMGFCAADDDPLAEALGPLVFRQEI